MSATDVVPLGFVVVSVAIAIGFLGEKLFAKTGIPDIVPIMVLGLAVGPIFGLIDPTPLLSVAPLFGAIALLIILFNAGLNLDFHVFVRQAPRAVFLAVLTFGLSVTLVTALATVLLQLPLLTAALLGSIVGGGSSLIVISYVQQMKLGEDVQTLLSLESTITDILCVVSVLIIIRILQAPPGEAIPIAQLVSARFSVGIVLGLILGVIWLYAFPRIGEEPYHYMVTLFMAFLTYGVTEILGGSGPLSTLMFGLVLGNGKYMSEIFAFERQITVSRQVVRFNSEISFLVRSIFFIYIGLISAIGGFQLVITGVIIAVVLLFARLLATQLATFRSDLTSQKSVISLMVPRGLASAVLASLLLTIGIPDTQNFLDMVFVVILATIIITVVGTIFLRTSSDTSNHNPD